MRSLIYLDTSCSKYDSSQPETVSEKALSDWNIIRSFSLTDTQDLITKHGISICIVLVNDSLINSQLAQLEIMVKHYSAVEWLAVSSPELLNRSIVCQFIRGNCYDYHLFPLDYPRLNASLGHAYGMANLTVKSCKQLKQPSSLPEMLGQSANVRCISKLIEKIAPVDAPVLVTGESGTGKELVAQSIHCQSGRFSNPFIAINCGAIPDHLIQSELFGHEKGAFTGANQKRIGRLESANGGTLFLDEIGDLPFKLQVNLLRCLQEGVIERLGGGGKKIPLDLRVIAATNVDLSQAIKSGTFREDLYYRLNVFNIEMPPLRERGTDAKILANHFLKKWGATRKGKVMSFSRASEQIIENYSWPGNIRELTNRVKRAALLCDSYQISPQDLGFSSEQGPCQKIMTLASAREEADKTIIVKSLAYTDHNITAASKLLDISRLSLYRLISKYALDSEQA